MHKLNLKSNRKRILTHVRQRVRDYPSYVNQGPGNDEDPISQISVGYETEQRGWFALVFDTRQNSKNDGEWTKWIDDVMIEFPTWLTNDDFPTQIEVNRFDSTEPSDSYCFRTLMSFEQYAREIGNMLIEALIELREKKVFQKLPLTPGCRIHVEEFDGHLEWPGESSIHFDEHNSAHPQDR